MSRSREDGRESHWSKSPSKDQDRDGDRNMTRRPEASRRYSDSNRPSAAPPPRRQHAGPAESLPERNSSSSGTSPNLAQAGEASLKETETPIDNSVLHSLSMRGCLWRNRLNAHEHSEKISRQIKLLKEKRQHHSPESRFDLATLQARHAQTTAEIQKFDRDIAKWDKLLQSSFLSKLAKLDQVEGKFMGLEVQLQHNQDRVLHEKQIGDHDTSRENDREALTKRLESAIHKIEQIAAENSSLKNRVGILEEKLEESSKFASRISELEQKVAHSSHLVSRVADLEQKLAQNNTSTAVRAQEFKLRPFHPNGIGMGASQNISRSLSPALNLSVEQIRHTLEAHDRQLVELAATRGPLFSPLLPREDSQAAAKIEVFSTLYKDLVSDVGAHKHRIERLEADMKSRPELHQSPTLLDSARSLNSEDMMARVRAQVQDCIDAFSNMLDHQGKRITHLTTDVQELRKTGAINDVSSLQADITDLKHRLDERETDWQGKHREFSIQVESMQEWQMNFDTMTFKREIANDVKALLNEQPHPQASWPFIERLPSGTPNPHTHKKRKMGNGQDKAVDGSKQQTMSPNGTNHRT